MKLSIFDMLRVWAALTGLAIAVVYFTLQGLDLPTGDMLPLLIAGIGGFELFLFGQDRVRNNRSGGLRG